MWQHVVARNMQSKTPMDYRCFAVCGLAALLMLVTASAHAQSTRTAEAAVQAALENEAIDAWVAARLSENEQARQATITRSNPTLAFGVDAALGQTSASGTELSWMLEQAVDVSRWRRDYRTAARHADEAIEAEDAAWRLEIATAVRAAFYTAQRAQRRLDALGAWVAALDQACTGVRARVASGDEAPIVLRRLEQALALAQLEQQAAIALAAETAATLHVWTGWQTDAPLEGALEPARGTATAPGARPELQQLEQAALAIEIERLALAPSFGQGWTVGVGYRLADTGPRAQHLVLGTLSLPLAFRDTNAPQRARLDAQAEAVRAERTRRAATYDREAEAAHRRYTVALGTLERGKQLAAAEPLAPGMLDAFHAGEAELTEVLDAFEQDRDIALTLIDLQWEARRAAIALDHALGHGVPE